MSKTIVITGASSGIGKATAQHFHKKGWNVVATMRKPENEKDLKPDARLKIVRLDVEDKPSIEAAVKESIAAFGKVDVWLNNAGYGAYGPLEAGTDEEIRRQYDVNFFGVIDCIKAILPHFKANKSGVIINITSIGGLMTLPLFGVYNSSKFALEGLSEGLWFDLKPFGIKVKVVEPGGIQTDFAGRSLNQFDLSQFPEYKAYSAKIVEKFTDPKYSKNFGSPEMVAGVIYTAATDGKDTLRYLAGKDAKQFWFVRRWLGYQLQMGAVKRYFGIN
ncbi:MAG: SDR family oxidoreductase [Chitinophagales bacterium]|nr:SDR family oxidoreductase [Chitinophagales bacterium]